MSKPSIVTVVLEDDYGDGLSQLPSGAVWVIDSSVNRSVAEKKWAENSVRSPLGGITLFDGYGEAREDIFLNVLDTIDLHHGEYSSDTPYIELRVIGTEATEMIKTELSNYGFVNYAAYPGGFSAQRSINLGSIQSMTPQLHTELWTSWASLLRSYSAAHGLNATQHAVVEVSPESITLRVGSHWMRFTSTELRLSDDRPVSFALHENGTVSIAGAPEEEMDIAAERFAREMLAA